jgi:hypothetical protein
LPLVSAQPIVFTDKQSHCRFRFWHITLPSEMANNQTPFNLHVFMHQAIEMDSAVLPANNGDIHAALLQVLSLQPSAQVVALYEAAAQRIADALNMTAEEATNIFRAFRQNPDIDDMVVTLLQTNLVDLGAVENQAILADPNPGDPDEEANFDELVDVEGGQQTIDGTWAADDVPPDDEGEVFFEPEEQQLFEAGQQAAYQQAFDDFQDMHPLFGTQAAALQAWHAWLHAPL